MLADYTQFTPVESLVGGAIIGFASVFMMIMFGRVAGVSGIIGSLFKLPKNDIAWRLSFLFGIISSGFIFSNFIDKTLLINNSNLSNYALVILAGVLVGFGTRLGSGCTSGHGICGISRLSKRSIVATCVFLGVAMLTVFIMKLIN